MSSTKEEQKPTEKKEQPQFTIKKKEADFSKQTDQVIEKSNLLVKDDKSKIKEAIDSLLVLEKQTRLGEDHESTARVLVQIVKLCAECGEWKLLNENIQTLTKKKSQSKIAVTKMVQEAMTYIDKTPSKEVKIELIETLRKVTAGKIYVELERARLTRELAKIREEEGNKKLAADIIQEIQIETIGTMEAREKIEFILEQMRLVLDIEDWVRASLIAKKITARALAEKEHQDLKIRYYRLMIRYYKHEKAYLDIATCYQHIYDTPIVKESNEWQKEMENMILFVILAHFDPHQYDFMLRISKDKNLEANGLAVFKDILTKFISTELIDWPEFQKTYSRLQQHPVFVEDKSRWDILGNRIVEHNLRVAAKYYSRIHTKRLAALLHQDQEKTEQFIANMVNAKTISAKIDRIDGIVKFIQPRHANEILNDWSSDTMKLLGLVEKSVHLINKELAQNKRKDDEEEDPKEDASKDKMEVE